MNLLLQYNACNVDNYLELKDLYSNGAWNEYKHHLFNQLNKITGADKVYFYEGEKMYLLKHLKKMQSLHLLRTYEQYLIDDYSEDLLNLNMNIIHTKAKKSKNRKEYRELAYMVSHLYHYKNKAEETTHITTLQENYKNRPVLIDELNQIKKI